jgi:hypothetical protein
VAHPLKNPHGLDLAELYPDLHRVWQTHLANRALIAELCDALADLMDQLSTYVDQPEGSDAEALARAAAVLDKARGEPCA